MKAGTAKIGGLRSGGGEVQELAGGCAGAGSGGRRQDQVLVIQVQGAKQCPLGAGSCLVVNLFIYQARESSLVPTGFLTAQFLQKL